MSKVKKRNPFSLGELETICKILADTENGLKGSEIEYYLLQIEIEDISPLITKWKRLYNALVNEQNKTNIGNKVLSFIFYSLEPARYVGNRDLYELKLNKINQVLAFHGLEFKDDGKFHKTKPVETLKEAEMRVNKLKKSIYDRKLHKDLLEFCRKELLQDNYFHAILEATKSINSKVQKYSGIIKDGAQLVDEAFGGANPILKINPLNTESEKMEQKGFMNLIKGLLGTFRNPTAHAPKIEWDLKEEDALDLFTFVSYILRRIDNCTRSGKK
ncbi:MAG: TIGR02391 family protein [bacterium]|nr:TIGR02391 family protein [bacterium]